VESLGHPTSFKVAERIMAYLRGGRVHPSALLSGPAGDGRWQIALSIAKQLLCPKATDGKSFCNECNTCRRIDKEIHPDVLIFRDLEEDTIKIDALRELSHQMSLTPMEARAKVCLMDECHRMNHAAANAFLKTLEEPGEGRFFWLLSSQPGSLPETVLSRCVKFIIPPSPELLPVVDNQTETYAKLLAEVIAAKNPGPAVTALGTKEKTLGFVQYLQIQLRNFATQTGDGPLKKLLPNFTWEDSIFVHQAALVLEGRLRSNANYGLMLESYLSLHFTGTAL
jgi:DNA polymerase-3 subunit delta'